MKEQKEIELIKRKRELKRLILLEECRSDYFTFLRTMFPVKDVSWGWHHEYTCNILQEFIEGMHPRLMIFMPPQHQKTTMLVEYLVPFAFGNNPDNAIILSMYNRDKASEYNKKVQRVIDNDGYRDIFPDVKLASTKDDYSRTASKFEIVNKRGFLYSVGVNGGIAGTPAKIALMDDVIKNYEEAYSPTYRERVYNWYTDELEARLHNDSKVAFTITRRHMDDLAGRLLKRDGIVEEGGKWKVITLPALKETNENPNDQRELGDALFPSLHSKERLEEIRDKNPRTFASLYQQRPSPIEGSIIKSEWFSYYEKSSFNLKNVRDKVRIYIDGAYTDDKNNDPSALFVYFKHQGKVYVLRSYQEWLEAPALIRRIKEIIGIWGHLSYTRVTFEPKASGKTLKQILKSSGILAKEDKSPTESKETRAEVITPYLERGEVLLPSDEQDKAWVNGFVDECTMFPSGRDDQVDCLTAVCRIELSSGNGIMWNEKRTAI